MKLKKGIGILISLVAISILIPTGNILLTPTEASVTVTRTSDPDGSVVKSLTISESSVEIVQGGTYELTAILDCNGSPNEDVTWSSSDEDNVEVTTPGSVSVATDAELRDYEITATSVENTSKSATSTIKVVEPLSISSELSDKTVYEGENASFTVEASGSHLTYKWQVDTGTGFEDISDGGVYSGATTSTLNITGATSDMNGYEYQVIVSGKVLRIYNSPSSKGVSDGCQLTIIEPSEADLTYQWQVDTGSGFTDISGATNTAVIRPWDEYYSGTYQVIGSKKLSPETSNSAVLTVSQLAAPSISSNPSGQTVYDGDNASFTVGASGSELTYQWQVDTGSGFTDIIDGGVYSGATTQTLNITNATLGMNGYKYQVVVSGKASPVATSNSTVLTVTKKSGTSSGGSSSSGSSSKSSSSSISDTNTDSTANSTNTVSSAENLADDIIKSIGGEVKSTETIKTQNGGSAVVAVTSINGKDATVVTTNIADKVEVKAAAGENTVVYVYVKELNAYMPVSSEVASDKVIFTANPGTAYVVADASAISNVVQAGWNKISGSWCYIKEDGSLAKGWYKDSDGTWYNLSSEGKMNTGWIKDTDGAWYYLDPQSGSMKTGWTLDNDGKWYYLNANGSMAYNTYIGRYRLGSDGAWIE